MAHRHITAELLRDVLDGEVRPRDLLRRLLAHLSDLCPCCREELSWLLEDPEVGGDGEGELSVARSVIDSVPPSFWRQVEAERRRREDELEPAARRDLATLLRLPPAERLAKVRRARTRYRNPLLVDLLLETARETIADDPAEARRWAELAREVALRLPPGFGAAIGREAAVRARAHEANALRAQGELVAAEQVMHEVLRQLEDVAEPLLRAEVSSLAASLRKDQRRFDEAADLLEQSLATYREVNEPANAGAVMLNQASLHFTGGRPLDAARVVEEALTLIDPETEPRLYLCGSHNLATYLCSAGLHAQAKENLDAHAELYRRFGDVYAQLRHEWLQGLIEVGLGRPAAAEETLRRVRSGFIDRGQGYDAALVTLDLALLYAEQGRHRDVLRLAEQTVPLFAAQDVHREALAALLMFQQAAREEAVTVRLVEQLAARLQQVRYDPRVLAELPS